MEIGGRVYEASIDGFPIDLAEGTQYTPHGKSYETQELVTGKTVAISKHTSGQIELPIKATNGMNADKIRQIFEDKMSSGGSTVVVRTATKVVRGLGCFIEGLPTESLDNGDITNVVVRTQLGLDVETLN
jgi:hypothetical protein